VPPNDDPRGLIVAEPVDPVEYPHRDSSLALHMHGIKTAASSRASPSPTANTGSGS
jgi:hypothetical protein